MILLHHLGLEIAICSLVIVLGVAVLGFTIFWPERWAGLVDRENTYWTRKGLVSSSLAEKFSRMEKGRFLKASLVVMICLTILLLLICVRLEHRLNPRFRRPMLPPPPVKRVVPANPPARIPPKTVPQKRASFQRPGGIAARDAGTDLKRCS